jgi:hypothetical protein
MVLRQTTKILSEVLWNVLQKERKERMALMPDEDFEGDFLEMQENNHGITNAASAVLYWFDPRSDMKMTCETDQNALLTYVIATINS